MLLISIVTLCTAKSDQGTIIRKINDTAQHTQPLKQEARAMPEQEESEEEPKPLTEEEQLEIFKQMNLPDTEDKNEN
jgi:hypothetical protein